MFLVSTLQSGYAANFVHMLSRQGKHIAYIIKTCKERGIKTIECTKEAEEEWTDGIVKGQWRSASFQQECTPGYYNLEGKLNDNLLTKRHGTFGAGPLAFCKVMEDWREKDDLAGLECVKNETAWVEAE
jgi:cyclohexanone monooxygenase